MKQLKVYGDTNTLRENASDAVELEALKKLDGDKRVKWFTSNIVHYEYRIYRLRVRDQRQVSDHRLTSRSTAALFEPPMKISPTNSRG
jgi:hypothetical protein